MMQNYFFYISEKLYLSLLNNLPMIYQRGVYIISFKDIIFPLVFYLVFLSSREKLYK